jgi:glycosyltransferase involved in cell wall biosynthesis
MLACMRIAALMPEAIVNSIYRTLIPMQALAHRGHAVHLEERNDVRDPEALMRCDAVHFMRFCHGPWRQMARRLKDAGVAVLWDNDDDIVARTERNAAGLRVQRMMAEMSTMIGCADIVTTPSEALAAHYRSAHGSEVHVIENYLPPTFVRPARVTPHTGVVIGWLAALEHEDDYEGLALRETIERVLTRHQHVEVISIGIDLRLRSRRYQHFPITMYGALPEIISHFDVAIAPLLDTPFNRSRSNVKVKEYAAMGVPWLASPIGPYAQLGQQQGGRLVPDDGWHEALEALVLDADARSRLARRGRLWAEGETIDSHVERWEAAFEEAIERARAAHAVR